MDKKQFYSYLKDVDAVNEESLDTVCELTIQYPWFQAGWLLYLKNLKTLDEQKYNVVLKKVAVMVPDRKVLFKFLNSELPKRNITVEKLNAVSTVYQLEGNSKLEKGNILIDKFLSSDIDGMRTNDIAIGNKQVSENKDFEKLSVAENDELVTETLAAIFFQQKNYEKAQEVYQKLSLKYPEKSIYFAGRIKEIEEIKKNN